MNRRWQKEGTGRYESLPSLGSMLAMVPPLTHDAKIADIADVYSTYSTLHAKSRNPKPMANSQRSFYYFLADAPVSAQRHMEEAAAAQEGMPIPPPSGKVRKEHVVPISSKYGGLTMERLRSLFFLGPSPDAMPHPTSTQGTSSKQKAAAGEAVAAGNPAYGEQATQPVESIPACGKQGTTGAAAPTTHEVDQGSAAVQGTTAAAPEAESQKQGHNGCVQDKGGGGQSCQLLPEAGSQGQWHHRGVQDKGEGGLTCQPPLQPASHIMLAIADDDGSVSLMRLFSHIQPPFEGPEVLPDAMAGREGVRDSDEDS